MTQKEIKELTELVKPVSQWLNDHGTPHSIVVVELDRFDLYEGICGGGLEYSYPESNEKMAHQMCETGQTIEEQKTAEWSEQDEKMRWDLINAFTDKNNSKVDEFMQLRATKADVINWLKSLRPSWKPSEQEKGALRTAIHILTEERNFLKAASHLQAILDTFEGKESRKNWKPTEEQMDRLVSIVAALRKDNCDDMADFLAEIYHGLEKLQP